MLDFTSRFSFFHFATPLPRPSGGEKRYHTPVLIVPGGDEPEPCVNNFPRKNAPTRSSSSRNHPGTLHSLGLYLFCTRAVSFSVHVPSSNPSIRLLLLLLARVNELFFIRAVHRDLSAIEALLCEISFKCGS